jgi:hypothetical protein
MILKLEDEHGDHENEFQMIRIEGRREAISVFAPGYATADELDGAPIWIERYNGGLRVMLWPDIQSEIPIITDLENAREIERNSANG